MQLSGMILGVRSYGTKTASAMGLSPKAASVKNDMIVFKTPYGPHLRRIHVRNECHKLIVQLRRFYPLYILSIRHILCGKHALRLLQMFLLDNVNL